MQIFFFCFILLFFLLYFALLSKTEYHYIPLAVLELTIYSWEALNSQRSTYISLLSAEIQALVTRSNKHHQENKYNLGTQEKKKKKKKKIKEFSGFPHYTVNSKPACACQKGEEKMVRKGEPWDLLPGLRRGRGLTTWHMSYEKGELLGTSVQQGYQGDRQEEQEKLPLYWTYVNVFLVTITPQIYMYTYNIYNMICKYIYKYILVPIYMYIWCLYK